MHFKTYVKIIFLFGIFFTVAWYRAESDTKIPQPWPITKIELIDQKHPYLFYNEAEIAEIRELAKREGTYQQKRFYEIKRNASNRKTKLR